MSITTIGTSYANDSRLFDAVVSSPRSKDRYIRVAFPASPAQQVSDDDQTRIFPEHVSVGEDERWRRDDPALTRIPASLRTEVQDWIDSLGAELYRDALRVGVVIPTRSQMRRFRLEITGGMRLTAQQVATAIQVSRQLEFDCPGCLEEHQRAEFGVYVAKNFATRASHEELADELSETKSLVSSLRVELGHARSVSEDRVDEAIKEATDKLSDAMEALLSRLQARDFTGCYGADDVEKITEMVEQINDSLYYDTPQKGALVLC